MEWATIKFWTLLDLQMKVSLWRSKVPGEVYWRQSTATLWQKLKKNCSKLKVSSKYLYCNISLLAPQYITVGVMGQNTAVDSKLEKLSQIFSWQWFLVWCCFSWPLKEPRLPSIVVSKVPNKFFGCKEQPNFAKNWKLVQTLLYVMVSWLLGPSMQCAKSCKLVKNI